MYLCVSVRIVPAEHRGGRLIPWSWSCRLLSIPWCGCWEQYLALLKGQWHAFNDRSIPASQQQVGCGLRVPI